MTKIKSIFFAFFAVTIFLFILESTARLIEHFYISQKKVDHFLNFINESNFSEDKKNLRIFIYGGSAVAGEPLPAVSFTEQLRYLLKELYPEFSIQITNFGKGGQDSVYVKQKIEETIKNEPNLIIVLTGHNEGIRLNSKYEIKYLKEKFALIRLTSICFNSLKRRFIEPSSIFESEKSFVAPYLETYRNNINSIIEISQKEKTPLLLCTVPANFLWPPLFENNNNLENYYYLSEGLLKEKKIKKLRKNLERQLEIDPTNSETLFLLGLLAYQSGSKEKAYTYLLQAKDFDKMPLRVLEAYNNLIREKDSAKNVWVVDLAKKFEILAPNGIIGYSLMADNCHPSYSGSALIAYSLLEALVDGKLLPKRRFKNHQFYLDQFLKKINFNDKDLDLKKQYLKNCIIYTSKPIFRNYIAAKLYMEKLLEVDSTNYYLREGIKTIKKSFNFDTKKIDKLIRQAFT